MSLFFFRGKRPGRGSSCSQQHVEHVAFLLATKTSMPQWSSMHAASIFDRVDSPGPEKRNSLVGVFLLACHGERQRFANNISKIKAENNLLMLTACSYRVKLIAKFC